MSIIKERILNKVDKQSNGCWVWIGCKRNNKSTYGAIKIDGKKQLAHRVSYTAFIGDIPTGKLVCHKCDNPPCVNPKHLFLGSHKDNSVDAYKKGRVKIPKGAQFKSGENHRLAKLSDVEAEEIRSKYKNTKNSLRSLGKEYGVDHTTVWQIVRGLRRKAK